MSENAPNPFALLLAVTVESLKQGLIAAMDTTTAMVNRVIRWLEKP